MVLLLIVLLGVLTPTFAVEEAVPEDIVPEVRRRRSRAIFRPAGYPTGEPIPPTLASSTRPNLRYMSCHGDKSAAVENRSLL